MKETKTSTGSVLAKGIVCGLAYATGLVVAGMITTGLHLAQPQFPAVTGSPGGQLAKLVAVSGLLGVFLVPLARGIAGGLATRWTALAGLIFVCMGVTSVMEMRIFTTYIAHGGTAAILAGVFLGAIACGGLAAALLRAEPGEASGAKTTGGYFHSRGAASWSWRIVAAVLAFPVAYFLFGMMVSPFVVWAYRSGNFGLVLPPIGVLLTTLFLRSVLFLLVSWPFLILWRRSRGQLTLALGLAHWMLVGLFGLLLGGNVFPPILRVAHSLEVGADSFVYAAALVFLLQPRGWIEKISSSSAQGLHAQPLKP